MGSGRISELFSLLQQQFLTNYYNGAVFLNQFKVIGPVRECIFRDARESDSTH